jgi:hypothetical protein
MRNIFRETIVPQRVLQCGLVALFAVALWGCSTVSLRTENPSPPMTLEEAKLYMASHDGRIKMLEFELNQQSRACYERFFVSDCLDEVRQKGAALRRAHLEAQGAAGDIVRLDNLQRRQQKK